MNDLDSSIPPLWRTLPAASDVDGLPIRKFFVTRTVESSLLQASLTTDLTFVYAGMPYNDQQPQSFYEGYDTGWGGIIRRFDVRRRVEYDILYKALLELENPTKSYLFILRGPAGSGKTIALKRSAFEAATASDALVLWFQANGALRAEVFAELYDLTKRPIYLFVDQIALHVDKLHPLLKTMTLKNIPLIVVGSESDADWSTYASSLDEDFTPQYLRMGFHTAISTDRASFVCRN